MDARNEIKQVLDAVKELEKVELPKLQKERVNNICHYIRQDLKMLSGQLGYAEMIEEFRK